MTRTVKELSLNKEVELGKNQFLYRFVDKEGNKYEWLTKSQRYFQKKQWWKLSFVEGKTLDHHQIITDVRYLKR